MKHLACFFLTSIVFLLAFFGARPALAMEFRKSDQTVTVAEDEVVSGSLFAGGNAIEIDGIVDGDLFCAGQTVLVRGSINGDILCAAQTIRIEGTVGGNIRSIGQTVDIEGIVERNVMVMGQTVTLGTESGVNREAVLGGQTLMIAGDIGEDILAGGNIISIDGSIGGDAQLAGQTIQVGQAGHVIGKLTYQSNNDALISGGATVGEVVKQPMPKEWSSPKESEKKPAVVKKPWPANALPSILTYIVIGAISILLFKKGIVNVISIMKEKTAGAFGIGLLWLCIFPVLFLLLILTIIGIPVAILYALFFAFVIVMSKLMVALYVGREVLSSFWKKKEDNWYLAVLFGVIISWLVFSMPIIGGLTSFLAILWGSGGLVKAVLMKSKGKK